MENAETIAKIRAHKAALENIISRIALIRKLSERVMLDTSEIVDRLVEIAGISPEGAKMAEEKADALLKIKERSEAVIKAVEEQKKAIERFANEATANFEKWQKAMDDHLKRLEAELEAQIFETQEIRADIDRFQNRLAPKS